MAVLSLVEWSVSCFGLNLKISVACALSWVAIMEQRGRPESSKPDQREEWAGEYGTANPSGMRPASSPWQHSDASSHPSHLERMLGKIPGTHPESQHSSLASMPREYQYPEDMRSPHALAFHSPGGMAVPGPMLGNLLNRAPGALHERPQYLPFPAVPAGPAYLAQQVPGTSLDMRNLGYHLPQGASLQPRYASEPNLASARGMPNVGQFTHTDRIFAEQYPPGPIPPNVRHPGDQYGVPVTIFQAPADAYSLGMLETANIQSVAGAGGNIMLLYDQRQQALLDETQHGQPYHVRQGYPSFRPPAAGYVAPSGGSGIPRDPNTPLDGRTQGQYGGGARPKLYPNRTNLPGEGLRKSNEDESRGIRPYLGEDEAEPSRSPATSYVGSSSGRWSPRSESPEEWISNRPETEGAGAGPGDREEESFEHPHNNDPPFNPPNTAPESRPEAVRRSLSKTALEKERMEEIRKQHQHFEEHCSQSLEDLHGELVELTKVQEVMDLWQYHSTKPRARSLVGCYQWYLSKPETCIRSLVETHRGTGDDSAAHYVFSLLMETNMKTGNLILYFKEQGRQDIVKCLREHHPSCPVCDQLN